MCEYVYGKNGEVIGMIVRDDRGSHYRQIKCVPAGVCVNYGLTTLEPQGNLLHRPI